MEIKGSSEVLLLLPVKDYPILRDVLNVLKKLAPTGSGIQWKSQEEINI